MHYSLSATRRDGIGGLRDDTAVVHRRRRDHGSGPVGPRQSLRPARALVAAPFLFFRAMPPEAQQTDETTRHTAKRGRGRPRRIERDEDLITPHEAGQRLGFRSSATIGDYIRRGLVRHVQRFGRSMVTVGEVKRHICPAVEQSARTLRTGKSKPAPRMGSAEGKMCAMAADLEDGAGPTRNGGGSGGQPLGLSIEIADNEWDSQKSALKATQRASIDPNLTEGGRGSDERLTGGRADSFGGGENFHIASAGRA